MNDTRSKTLFSLVAVLMLLFSFGLGALSSYVLVGPSQAASRSADSGNTPPGNVAGNSQAAQTPAAIATPSQDLTAQMQNFYEVVDLMKKESYYRPMDNQKLVYGAIQGMMH